MIVHPAKHLFEARFPTLEDGEEEIFYQHPLYNIKVNQLGVIYCDDSEYGIYDKKGNCVVREHKTLKNCGNKSRVIWECYHGEILSNAHFLFANANPMDTRKENLLVSSKIPNREREVYLSLKSRFVKASVEHLIKIEERMQAVGVDKKQVYEILQLPYWLEAARGKYKPTHVRLPRSGSKVAKPRTTEAEADEIERLFHMGLTFYAIIDRFGWSSTSRVKKVVLDRKLVR
jgi:hypothetical protein